MGEVYRATDTNLKREVAIKVMPESVATDPERLARFQREAEVLASLNHPNIAAIHGLERAGGHTAIVMELVDGPTLADRIAGGAMPLDDVLSTARQIAEALEAAHEHGVVHRDLKPANIKLRADGTVKVLDFGLAKAVDASARADQIGGLANSPTITSPAGMTRAGTILGTAAYMSPEQAKGRPVDRRADLWAFGCVIYEMLAGRRPFDGGSVSETLAEVLKSDPDYSALPAGTPSTVVRLLRRCLTKDPKRRLPDAGAARLDLEETSETAVGAAVTSPHFTSNRERIAWTIAAILLVAASGLGWMALAGRGSAAGIPQELRLEVTTPGDASQAGFSLSPDGTRLVYIAGGRLWLRDLNRERAQPIAEIGLGGFGGSGPPPIWAPDGRAVAFTANNTLRRLTLADGVVQPLVPTVLPLGGAWGADDVILYSASATGPLMRVSAFGQTAVEATRLAPGHVAHRFPSFLPDGRRFLFTVAGDPDHRGIYLGTIDSNESRRLSPVDSAARFLPPDLVVYASGGGLVAQRFDDAQGLVGDTRAITTEAVKNAGQFNALAASTSASGVVAYRAHEGSHQLVWLDRTGAQVGTVGSPIRGLRQGMGPISQDGQTLALTRTFEGNTDVWLVELRSGTLRRLTTDPSRDAAPVFSPDGQQVAYSSERAGVYSLFLRPSDGTGTDRALLDASLPRLSTDWSSDRQSLMFTEQTPDGADELMLLPLDGGQSKVFIRTRFQERDGRFSPDGRWILYSSTESGRFEYYLQPLVGPGSRVQISNGALRTGGARWRRDGREIFYLSADRRVMSVPVSLSGSAATVGSPVALFTLPGEGGFTPAPDGQRFLVPLEVEAMAPVTILLNWAGLRR